MRMKRWHYLVFLWAALSLSPRAVSAEETIKIGFPMPLSGPTAVYGVPITKGAEMAVADVNAKGGVLGPHPLQIRHRGGDPIGRRGQAFLRRLVATVTGSVVGFCLSFRPPDTGRSNALWRRSGAALARLLGLAPFATGSARLRFSAAIRSMTGAGVETSCGSIGR